MGRYISGSFDYKFWFGQPSSDILQYGEEDAQEIHTHISYKSLKDIKKKVTEYKTHFKKKFKITYEQFINKIDKKGYLSSSNDKETNTEKWSKMSREASFIDLGLKIIKELNKQKKDLYVEAEY